MAKKKQPKQTDPKLRRQRQVLFGGALLLLALLLAIAFISYLFSWKADYSTLNALTDRSVVAQNILNKLGAFISHYFIYHGIGLGAFIFPYLIGLSGYKLFFDGSTKRLVRILNFHNWTIPVCVTIIMQHSTLYYTLMRLKKILSDDD